ncbi:MAG: SMP-30/gluconolactonase/LRE family protein [Christensenellales bacterium]|jgi:sugar lactone lactonase YvrE
MRIISDHKHVCGESPVWHEGSVWWVDNEAGGLFRFTPDTGELSRLPTDIVISCFAFNKQGGMVCGTGQGVFLYKDNQYTLLAAEHEGQKLKCNDSSADPKGRYLFDTTYFDDSDSYPLGKLYAMERDGSVRVLDEGLHLGNGIGFSPDGSRIYYVDTVIRTIYTADYDVEAGEISNKRVFLKLDNTEGIPDGLTVDADGNIWFAQWFGGCIDCYSPSGERLRRIEVEARQVTSLAFGGKALNEIFITSADYEEEMSVAPVGYDYSAYRGGPVYCYTSDAAGKPELLADINVR